MIHYILHTADGTILKSATTTEDSFALVETQEGEILQVLSTPLGNPESYYWKNDELRQMPPKPDKSSVFDPTTEAWVDQTDATAVARAKRIGEAEINIETSKVRSLFITSIVGQDGVYAGKKAEAIAYLSVSPEPADLSAYPFLANEVGLTAPTAYELAQLWLNMSALWTQTAANLENVRLSAIKAVSNAVSANEIETIVTGAKAALRSVVEN